jgi:hypothetical protein
MRLFYIRCAEKMRISSISPSKRRKKTMLRVAVGKTEFTKIIFVCYVNQTRLINLLCVLVIGYGCGSSLSCI